MTMATGPSGDRWRRLVWFAGLWLAGVMAIGAVSLLLRAVVAG